MATSLTQILYQAPPPRAKRAHPYAVEIRRWRPRRKPEIFDVIMPCGLLLRGCYVYVKNSERRVRAVGFEFDTPEARDRVRVAVLRALDASQRTKRFGTPSARPAS